MTEARRRRITIAGAVVTAVALAGTGLLLCGETGSVGCAASAQFGWLTPVVTAMVLGGAAFVLAGQRRSGRDGAPSGDVVPCSACGRELFGEWRMCPYCGAMIRRNRSPRAAETAPEQSS
ncbi:MAG: hypothetical protein ISP10_03190 [Aeromicrobium sp.]|nr:hypothetical protein [Aeromicrobium sp.]